MPDLGDTDFNDQVEEWAQNGIHLMTSIAAVIRESAIADSKEAYQIAEYLSKLESWDRELNNTANLLLKLIDSFNAT